MKRRVRKKRRNRAQHEYRVALKRTLGSVYAHPATKRWARGVLDSGVTFWSCHVLNEPYAELLIPNRSTSSCP